jgi:hypothetical protein
MNLEVKEAVVVNATAVGDPTGDPRGRRPQLGRATGGARTLHLHLDFPPRPSVNGYR